MHGSTSDAGMVMHGSAYRAPYDATLAEKGREKRELRELRVAIAAKTAPLLDSSVQSIETDVTGFVDRIRPAQGRSTRVVIFSDLISETPALNLSKRAMTDADIAPTITRLARSAHWGPRTLSDVAVYFVLDAAQPNTRRINDRRVLGRFYTAFVEALGGTVGSFDTSLRFPTP